MRTARTIALATAIAISGFAGYAYGLDCAANDPEKLELELVEVTRAGTTEAASETGFTVRSHYQGVSFSYDETYVSFVEEGTQ